MGKAGIWWCVCFWWLLFQVPKFQNESISCLGSVREGPIFYVGPRIFSGPFFEAICVVQWDKISLYPYITFGSLTNMECTVLQCAPLVQLVTMFTNDAPSRIRFDWLRRRINFVCRCTYTRVKEIVLREDSQKCSAFWKEGEHLLKEGPSRFLLLYCN